MTDDPVFLRVVDIVCQIAGPRRAVPIVEPATPLSGGGFWLDSLDLVNVMLLCEEGFGDVFSKAGDPLSLAESLRTVGELVSAIHRGQKRS